MPRRRIRSKTTLAAIERREAVIYVVSIGGLPVTQACHAEEEAVSCEDMHRQLDYEADRTLRCSPPDSIDRCSNYRPGPSSADGFMKPSGIWLAVILVAGLVDLFVPHAALSVEESKPVPASPTPTVPSEGDRQKEAEEIRRLQAFYLRNQSVFIRKGEAIVELNSFYSTDENLRLVQVSPTTATIVQTTSRFYDTTLFGRYGLAPGLEFDLIAPVFVHAEQEFNVGTGTTTRASSGVGDIAAALRYQIVSETGLRPSVILDVQGKSRTAGTSIRSSGNYNVGGGITLVKSIDPVVFFGRLGYTETLAYGGRNNGNIVNYSLGMGFSLNDRVAFNMQLTGAVVGRTQLRGQVIDGSSLEIANLLFSTTILATKKLILEPIVGIGLTDDAFDATIGLRIPYRF